MINSLTNSFSQSDWGETEHGNFLNGHATYQCQAEFLSASTYVVLISTKGGSDSYECL